MRYLFPRGRVQTDYFNPGMVFVAASKELEPYKSEIARKFNISFRAAWDFTDPHYAVDGLTAKDKEHLRDYIEGALVYEPHLITDALLSFLNKYVPETHQWIMEQTSVPSR